MKIIKIQYMSILSVILLMSLLLIPAIVSDELINVVESKNNELIRYNTISFNSEKFSTINFNSNLTVQPSYMAFGKVYKDSIIEANFMIISEINIEIYSINEPSWVIIKEVQENIQYNWGIGSFIYFSIDTSYIGEYSNPISVETDIGTVELSLKITIRDNPVPNYKLLITTTPFEAGMPEGDYTNQLTKIIGDNNINISYTETIPTNINDFDGIILDYYSLLLIQYSQEKLMKIKNYINNGGTVILFANHFFRGTVTSANQIINDYGLRMLEEEESGFVTVINDDDISPDSITSQIHNLQFHRPSPIEKTDASAEILVQNPNDPFQGYVAVSRNNGEVIVIGQSLFISFINYGDSFDNDELFKNIFIKKELPDLAITDAEQIDPSVGENIYQGDVVTFRLKIKNIGKDIPPGKKLPITIQQAAFVDVNNEVYDTTSNWRTNTYKSIEVHWVASMTLRINELFDIYFKINDQHPEYNINEGDVSNNQYKFGFINVLSKVIYTLGKHTYSFPNWNPDISELQKLNNDFKTVKDLAFDRLTSQQQTDLTLLSAMFDIVIDLIKKQAFCFGMATTSQSYYNGRLDSPAPGNVFDMTKNTEDLVNKISEIQTLQLPYTFESLLFNSDSLQKKYDTIKNSVNKNNPVIITIDKGLELGQAHVVVGYEINGDYVICYDPSYVYLSRVMFFDFNLDQVRWVGDTESFNVNVIEEPILTKLDAAILFCNDFWGFINNNVDKMIELNQKMLKLTIACPVMITIYDEQNRMINETINEIPNADFKINYDIKTVFLPSDNKYNIVIKAYDEGYFSFMHFYPLNQHSSDDYCNFTGFFNLSLTANSVGYIEIPKDGKYEICMDYNNNGIIDERINDDCNITLRRNIFPSEPIIIGPSVGEQESQIRFEVKSIDKDDEKIFLYIDWDDGTNTGWIGPINSGEEHSFIHIWNRSGNYNIKAIARDERAGHSQWSNLYISINASLFRNKPNIIINFPVEHSIINQIINIEWTAHDTEDGTSLPISLYLFDSDNDITSFPHNPYENTGSLLWDTTIFSDGDYKLVIQTQDSDSNMGVDSCHFQIKNNVETENHAPNKPAKPQGETSGKAGEEHTYSTTGSDIDDDLMWFKWDWGDGTYSDWEGPYTTLSLVESSHIWDEEDDYQIRVKAKDEHGLESAWSDPLQIEMPKTYSNPILQIILRMLERFPFLSNLLIS